MNRLANNLILDVRKRNASSIGRIRPGNPGAGHAPGTPALVIEDRIADMTGR